MTTGASILVTGRVVKKGGWGGEECDLYVGLYRTLAGDYT